MRANFVFNDDALADVNWDGDLFYDLTDGGYIDTYKLLKDLRLAQQVKDAAELVNAFLNAASERAEQIQDEEEEHE